MEDLENKNDEKQPEASEENRDFNIIREKIKSRPVNKGKLARSTLVSAVSALVFGLVACVAFFALAPWVSGYFEKEEEEVPKGTIVVFPEETIEEETNPEDMLITNEPEFDPAEIAALSEEELEKAISKVEFTVSDYQKIYQTLAGIATNARKSIVRVRTVTTDTDWFNNMFEETSEQTGLIVADNGVDLFILTYRQGISDGEDIYVTFVNDTTVKAELQSSDSRTGLCILSIPLSSISGDTKSSYEIAVLGTSNSSRLAGSLVIAVGSPMGNYGSMNYGMITSINRDITVVDHQYRQITTDIYGSTYATGVLINAKGDVLGIIDTKYSDPDTKNLISAIGVSELKKTIEKMINGQTLIRFGITGANVPDEAVFGFNAPKGAFVKTVEMDSPAMAGGIQAGDIIVSVGGHSVTGYMDLVAEIREMQPDVEIEVVVSRMSLDGYKRLNFAIVPEVLGGSIP